MGISTTRSVLLGVVWGAAGLASAATDVSLPAFAQARDGSSVAAAIDLNGPWQFKATDETAWMDAVVPGVVQSDLLRVGRLKDPHYRDQELDAQWVERKEWEYRRRFRVGRDFLRHDAIRLDCRGLDTIAEVYLNERLVAKTENMHRRHEFDVKPLLRAGENEIRVVFRSILEWNRQPDRSGAQGPVVPLRGAPGLPQGQRLLRPQGGLRLRLGLGPAPPELGDLAARSAWPPTTRPGSPVSSCGRT